MKKSILFAALSLLLLYGCNPNELDVDISGVITEPLKVLRLEEDVFALNGADFETKSAAVKTK